MRSWTPARGAAALAEELGPDAARAVLVAILSHEDVPLPLFLRVMTHVSGTEPRSPEGPFATPGWNEWPQVWSARALGYLGGDGAEDALIGAYDNPHWHVRRAALRSLGWIGGTEALSTIQRAYSDPDHRVRTQASVSEVKVLERIR